MLVLRSLLFNAGMILFAVVFAVVGLLFTPFPFRIRYGFISQWARVTLWWLGLTCNLRFEVEGRDNIPGGAAASIIFCKHQSAWETLALQLIFPPQVWLMKRNLLWIPFFGWGLAMLEPIAINRNAGTQAMRQLVTQGTARLRAGRWVVIFPEGTRVAPGQRGTYHKGGALLAEKSGAPVVPVAHNAGEFWPKHGFIKKPGIIRVVIGPTLQTTGLKANEINAQAEQWIEAEMQRIHTRQ